MAFATSTMPPPVQAAGTSVNTHLWPRLFADGQHLRLCQEMIYVLDTVGRSVCFLQDSDTLQRIDQLLSQFFCYVVNPAFVVPDELSEKFINLNPSLAALAALSSFKTTDTHLEILKRQPNNFLKILALYSAHNSVKFDRRLIFQVDARLASTWYVRFSEAFRGSLVSPLVMENLREHFQFVSENLLPVMGVQEPFFGVSYAAPAAEQALKQQINKAVRARWAERPVRAFRPEPRRIAVVTGYWNPGHSVYRIVEGLLRALRPKYQMTFFRLGENEDQDTSLFDECHVIRSRDGVPEPGLLASGKFQAILYPDIGMFDQSIHLANMRLAPVQMTFTGHSVSTFGADIDYYISGAAVEVPERPERFYSERLVLLPGMGCVHKKPTIGPFSTQGRPPEPIVINCPWSGHKINHRLLEALGAIAQRSTRPIRFRVFTGGSLGSFKELALFDTNFFRAIPRNLVEVLNTLAYPEYMAAMSQGHFSLDPFHFSGCNTVSDSLHLRVPILCREGERWYNRIGPQMLRLAGVPELIATTDEAYISQALRLIHDDPWRDSLRMRLMAADLDATVYGTSDAEHFARVFDDILAKHACDKGGGLLGGTWGRSREPIRVVG